jgi:phosphoribosylaminoimidazole-succinocarboxamide synthase
MSEETTEKLKTSSTNPLPFEVVVTNQLALILSRLEQSETEARAFRAEVNERFDRLEERQTKLEERQTKLEERQTSMEAEQVKTTLELHNLTQVIYRIDERLMHYADKTDIFISEQLVIKKELFRVQKAVGLQPGLERLAAEMGVSG